MITVNHFINGSYTAPSSGTYLDGYNPATGDIFSKIALGDAADVQKAVDAARTALPAWKAMPAEDRFRILNAIAEGIEANLDELAAAESRDQGKPFWLSKTEMQRASQNFRFFATAAVQFASESHQTDTRAINYTLRQPVGIVGCISPWNLPLYLFTWKIAPALAAGNCVVAKPSEFTPLTAYMLCDIANKAGLPPGVLNVVHGLGTTCGQAIVEHPEIKAVSFTGGTATGKHIASVAAPMFKKLSLELGGKNPNIIFEDADLNEAVKTSVRSSFLNQGEICLCGSRVFVHTRVYDAFKTALLQEVAKMQVGDPFDEKTRVGAIVSKPHFDKVLSYIDLAKQEGGHVLCGGHAVKPNGFENGWFIAPTIIEGLDANCRTNTEEIFGPVITLIPFETEEEVLKMANGTAYGLAATLWTTDLKRAHRMAEALQSGIVWVNCWLLRDLRTPFGGVKQSGVGREGGWEAMRFFTEPKNVCIAY
ncbi:MAG: aldehyde dehydrogenase [Sphingomonadales bacterium]|jgi:aminomuconate-semialdehyde/2-hydroxymuconate-6-semialdehyde dehydrogenase